MHYILMSLRFTSSHRQTVLNLLICLIYREYMYILYAFYNKYK